MVLHGFVQLDIPSPTNGAYPTNRLSIDRLVTQTVLNTHTNLIIATQFLDISRPARWIVTHVLRLSS